MLVGLILLLPQRLIAEVVMRSLAMQGAARLLMDVPKATGPAPPMLTDAPQR